MPMTAKPGLALVLPSLEKNLNAYGHYEITFDCMRRSIARLGCPVRVIDPRDRPGMAEVLESPDFPLLLTVRSQSEHWQLPDADTAAGRLARQKTLIVLMGNPPYFEGSARIHRAPFTRILARYLDGDSIEYAESINTSNAQISPHRTSYHDVFLDPVAAAVPASRRPVPILFVGTYDPPETFRGAWRAGFAAFPHIVQAIEDAAGQLADDLAEPVWKCLRRVAAQRGVEFDLRSKAGRLALDLLTRYVNNSARGRVLRTIAGFPSTIVATNLPDGIRPHPHATIRRSAAFSEMLELMHRSRCMVALNPNWMTGGISERVPNALARGAYVVNAPNSALAGLAAARESGVICFGNRWQGLTEALDAAASGDAGLDALGHGARRTAEAHFRMDDAFCEILRQATGPAR